MTNISKPIIFFGTEDFSLITLQALIEAGFPIAAVVTKPDSSQGRGHKLMPPPAKKLAQTHNIPVWQPQKLSEISENIQQIGSPIGVLVSYGKIIPQSIIDLFDPGIINLHPSLLPKYRGPSPIESAILHGDSETGISIMQLSAAMDAGPVYRQEQTSLEGTETKSDLYARLGNMGTSLLLELLPQISNGSLIPQPQDDQAASYCSIITKTDGIIDWRHESAAVIERKVRAYQHWPQVRTRLGDVDSIITDAHVVPSTGDVAGTIILTDDSLTVATIDGALAIDAIKPIGKKEMPVQAFLAGYRSRLTV